MTHETSLMERPILAIGSPVLVISPHLDDAVFGCGELLAACPGSVVVTVMAGRPAQYAECTPWDALAGFGDGDDVVAARREEDRAALALLAGRPFWLDFLDSQYRDSPTVDALAVALEAAIVDSGLETVLLPLGLFHSDHHLTHAAALAVLRRRPALSWFAYEDALYRKVPNLGTARFEALGRDGVSAVPIAVPAGDRRETKRQAMQRYASQLRALATPGKPGYEDALEPERYWRLTLLPAPTPGESGRRPAAGGDRAG
jgi:LmbE family N-acetylglucosaminyl deacetylase